MVTQPLLKMMALAGVVTGGKQGRGWDGYRADLPAATATAAWLISAEEIFAPELVAE
jgi:hypothetical protein